MSAFVKQKAFTVVELLIVIVVIGILASLTVAAYNGVRTRATDSLVMSDLKSNIKRVSSYTASTGNVPSWGNLSPTDDTKMKVSKRSAYEFFYYCAYAVWFGQPLSAVGLVMGTTTNKTYASTTATSDIINLTGTVDGTTPNNTACASAAPSGLTAIQIGALIRTDGVVDGSVTVAAP
jgi:prepilin-type N-terminal cleavage/methylation domain-containing protein